MKTRVDNLATRKIKQLLHDRITANNHSYAQHSLAGAAANARRDAETEVMWETLDGLGLVRFTMEPDELNSWDDLEGDCYDVKLNADSVPGGARAILSQQKEFRRRVEQDGVWVAVGQYRTSHSSNWEIGDSIGGIVGDERDHYYDNDVKSETIYSLKNALKSRCPNCRRTTTH